MHLASHSSATSCPICGCEDVVLAAPAIEGFRQGTTYRIWECAGCEVAFADPRADDPIVYDAIYRLGDAVPGYSRYHLYRELARTAERPLDALADREESYWSVREVLKVFERRTDRKPTILEVGCGMAYTTAALHRSGADVVGCDISASAIELASRDFPAVPLKVGSAIEVSRSLGRKFDIVIACQIIEHTPDPVAFLSSLVPALADDGIIIVTTPQRGSQRRYTVLDTYLPPVHWWWFSERALLACARQSGLAMQRIDLKPFYASHQYAVIASARAARRKKRGAVLDSEGRLLRSVVPMPVPAAKERKVVRRAASSLMMRVRGQRRCLSPETARDLCVILTVAKP